MNTTHTYTQDAHTRAHTHRHTDAQHTRKSGKRGRAQASAAGKCHMASWAKAEHTYTQTYALENAQPRTHSRVQPAPPFSPGELFDALAEKRYADPNTVVDSLRRVDSTCNRTHATHGINASTQTRVLVGLGRGGRLPEAEGGAVAASTPVGSQQWKEAREQQHTRGQLRAASSNTQ
jgi:hypothetical protein